MLLRPSACRGCDLDTKGSGFAPPEGPVDAELLFLGESLGATEVATGRPFVGDAGSMLQRIFNLLGWERGAQRIGNSVSCRPPNDWLDERAPWYYNALNHCAVHREPLFAENHKVTIALGGTALKVALGLVGQKKIKVADWHGTINQTADGRIVVPTFHPSFLQRGAHNLIGTVLWDLQQAKRAAQDGLPPIDHSLVLDPDLDWFRSWVDTAIAARQQDPWAYPISADVETPDKAHGKDEGEITVEDRSFTILRQNFACHPDEGLTVPQIGPFVDEMSRLYASPGPIWMWNKEYDFPRLVAAGQLHESDQHRVIDLMWLWHALQSDLPRGLGFVAPFYSTYGPWKHLSDSEPAKYGAIDGLQTHRIGFGVLGDLQKLGMYESAMRHVHQLHHQVLKPAQHLGVKIDRSKLTIFSAQLATKASDRLEKLQECFPIDLRNLSPKQGLTKKPADNVLHVKASAFTRKGKKRAGKEVSEIKLDLYKQSVVLEKEIQKEVLCCESCGATEISRKHRCDDRSRTPVPTLRTLGVTRYFWSEPFNPDSWQQVLGYIKHRKHEPGKAKKTHKETTNRETLERLTKTGDPFYKYLLDYRAVQKVKGTYVDGTERRLDDADRVHPEPTFKPSTQRLSYQNPNITNVIQDRGGVESLAAGFRSCVVAGPDCWLLEVDFSGSEAVDVGWLSRDPGYIRLAKLGVHAGLASHILKRPYDPKWSDEDLGKYFKTFKEAEDGSLEQITYNRAKRFVHGYSYGLTTQGMVLQFPEIFPTKKIAEEYAALFRSMAPKVPAWQTTTRELAFKQHYLGGPGAHPFGYKHWFWSVFTYKKITSAQYWSILARWKKAGKEEADCPVTIINGHYFKVQLGEDGKRCVAFMPQSITAGKLKEVMLRLFDPESPSYIGEAYYGQTPLRAPIHDSLLLEIPKKNFDFVASVVYQEMTKPIVQMPCPAAWGIGEYLVTGASAKVGADWQKMQKFVPELGVGSDTVVTAAEPDEADEVEDLGRTA